MPRIRILADNTVLYDSNINNTSRAILEPSLSRDLEGSPQFDFKILPDHPEYNNLNRLKTKVHVYLDEDEIFYGRVLDYETDMWLQRTVKCEGAISFLVDSMNMPQKEERKTQVRPYFEYLINEHNSQVEQDKQFVIGTFDHPDADEYINVGNGSYRTVKDAIQNDLITIRGGYLNVRYVNGVNYIDFVYDPSVPSGQSFEIGENIIDLLDSTDSMEVCTILYPVGEGNLTIEEVAGQEYIESTEGIARYGRIAKSKTFKGVTTARELYDKALAYLNSKINKVYKNFTLTAIDLGLINNTSKVKPGSVVHLYSQSHGIDGDYMCYETTTNLFNPEEDSFTFKEWVSNEDALVETNTTSKWEHHYGNFTHEWVKNFEHDFDEYFKIHADYILLDARERIDILAGDLIMLSSKYIELDAQQRIQLKAINENSDGLINVISDLTFIGGELFDTENRLTELGQAVYQRIEGVEGSVTAIGTEVNLIGDKAITNEGRIAELGQSVTQINSDVILLGDQTRELNDFYDALHTTVDGHTNSITAITTDVTLIGNKADQAIDDLADLSGSVVALEADNVVLHGDVTNLTTRVGNISAEQITISTQVDDIDQRLVTIEGDTVTIDGKIVALAGDVSSMKTDGFTTIALNATSIVGTNTTTGSLNVTGSATLASLTSSGQIVANGGIASSGECGFRSASIGTLTVSGTLQSAHSVSMSGIGASANFLGTDDVSFDHYHSFTTGTDGVITIGGPSLTPGNFNIADTKFYKDEIKKFKVTNLIGGWDEENEQYIITCQNESSGSVYEKPISASHAIAYGESLVTLSVGSWSSNKAVVNASNGESVTVDATSIYNNGVASVTLSGGTVWTNGTTTVSASNGQTKSVSLPAFSSSVSTNWTSDWKKTVNFSTGSVSVPLKSEIIDASGVYSTGYRDGVSAGGSEGYESGYEDGEASVTLSGGTTWSSNKTTVTASNGKTLEVDATSIYNNGYSTGENSVTLSGGTTWSSGSTTVTASNGQTKSVSLPAFSSSVSTNWTSDWKKTVNFSTASVSVPLRSETIDASGVYNSGVSSVTLSGGTTWSSNKTTVTASNGQTKEVDATSIYDNGRSVGAAAVTLSGGTNWSSNKTTVLASNGKSISVDATSIYNNGYSAGEDSVTLSGGTVWTNGSTTVTASNDRTQNVSLPAFSSSVSTNWTSDWKKTVNFSTASVSVPLRSETIDASGVYNSGVSSVTLSGGTTWSSNKTTVTASNGQTITVDATSIYANGYRDGVSAGGSEGYESGYEDGEASVTLSGGTTWSSNKTTVTASNGKTIIVDATSIYTNGYNAGHSEGLSEGYDSGYSDGEGSVTLSGGTTWSSNKTTVSASNGQSVIVDATSIYNSGVSSVTLSGGTTWSSNKTTVTASNGQTKEVDATSIYDNGRSVGAAAVTLSGGTTWSSNKTTVLASNGKSVTVDATSIYNNGFSAGESGVTLSGGTVWSSGTTTVTASNGQTQSVSLPAFSSSVSANWSSSWTKTVNFSTASVSVPLRSETIDASGVYSTGYDAGEASVTLSGGTTWTSNKTTVSASNGESLEVDATSRYNSGYSSGQSSVTLSGGTTWSSNKTTVSASNGKSVTVDATSIYTNGYNAGHSDGVSEGYDSGYSAGESAGYDSGYAAGWAAAAATFSSGISGNVISVTGPSTTVGSSTSSSYTVTAAIYNFTLTGTYSKSTKVVTSNAGATPQAYVNGSHVYSGNRQTKSIGTPAV